MKKVNYSIGMLAAMLLLSACAPNNNSSADINASVEVDTTPSEIALEVMEEVKMEEEKEKEAELVESVEVSVAASTSYQAGAMQAYSKQAFDEAVANGDPVLLDFHASWCHVCRDNAPKIKDALEGTDVVGLQIDYDNAQDLRAKYGVVSQSTLVVLRDGKETKRAMGAQSETSLSEFLQ